MSYDTLPGRGSIQSFEEWKGINVPEELGTVAVATAASESSSIVRVLTGGFMSVSAWAGNLDRGVGEIVEPVAHRHATDVETGKENHVDSAVQIG